MNQGRPAIVTPPDQAPGFRAIRFNLDWITRPLFGGLLAAAVVAAVFGGTIYIALFGLVAGVAAAREWHRMIGEHVYGPGFVATSAALFLALGAAVTWPSMRAAVLIVAGAIVVVAIVGGARQGRAGWHGLAPLYIGAAPLALMAVRGQPHGAWIVVGMFLAVWSTDSGALIVGNLVGGPRLWPALSPNKTWAGTLGGIAVAAAVEAIYVAVLGGAPIWGGLYGAAIAVAAHCGDLFESWVKRVFQRKDSGGMIPGHGGVLDRIDSTLFAAPALAAAVFVAGLDPVFGAHP